nr:DnaB-like helicase C-terminal domain-containing protein [Komagataeibacter medellinensis]
MNTIQNPPSAESRQKDSLLGVSQRLPPANVQAEQALLGALLTNNRAYDRVSDFLTGAHFANEVNGRIYDAISRRIEGGQLADPVTLRAEFENTGVLDSVGGTAYLAKLLTSMVGIINAADYGRVIHDAWIRRQLIDIGQDVVNNAFGARPELDGPNQIAASEEALFRLATEKGQDGGFMSFDRALADALEIAQQAFSRSGDVVGLTTGLRDLDKKTGGLHPSDLLILAGRPAMARRRWLPRSPFPPRAPSWKKRVMPAGCQTKRIGRRLLARNVSRAVGNPYPVRTGQRIGEKIRRGDLGQKEFDRFVQVSRELAQLPLHIDDTPAISLSAMRTRCRRLARTKGLSLVVVDYLQLMRPSVGSRAENRVLEISMITQGLKALAKELSVPVIALSQLSRQVESREDKRPMLSDLRESGSIEQDADAVMFVYRDQYYLQQRQPKETSYDSQDKYQTAMEEWQRKMDLAHNRAELILEKQRHGPTGTVHLFFEGEFTRFADLDMVHDV